jgi:hypothetical protein
MYEKTNKITDNKNQTVINTVAQKKSNANQTFALEDNRTESIVQKKLETTRSNLDVAQLGKKRRDLERAKKNNPNGLQHHNRPEYQDVNERQMQLINEQGLDRKEAKRQAKHEIKTSKK